MIELPVILGKYQPTHHNNYDVSVEVYLKYKTGGF